MSEAMTWLMGHGIRGNLYYDLLFPSFSVSCSANRWLAYLLYVTRPGQIIANNTLYKVLSGLVNIFRSIPFIILLEWMILPWLVWVVGTSIGLQAAIVPLTVGATSFIDRMVENVLCWRYPTWPARGRHVPWVLHLCRSLRRYYCLKIYQGLVNTTTITLITLVGYLAIGGAVEACGLG